jgi:subtilase family serine protease
MTDMFDWPLLDLLGRVPMIRRHRLLSLAAATSVALGFTLPASAQSNSQTLPGQVPSWASSANYAGAASASDAIGFRVYLGWRNAGAAESFASAVSDPVSSRYGQYLTPQEFRQEFAPSQASVSAVKAWLAGQGFDIVYTPMNNHYIEAEGTVARVQTAFGTSIGYYNYSGLTLRSPGSDLSVPAAVAPLISGVVGLDESAALVHTDIAPEPNAPPPAAFVTGTPCSVYWGEKLATGFTNPYGTSTLPYAPCGYLPQQVKGAYGISSAYSGAGQTVAIIDAYASPTIVGDANRWSQLRGLPELTRNQFAQVVAPGTFHHPESGGKNKQDPQGWYGEETLDVESVHGMAPGASIVYVGAPNNFQDLDAALNHVVDRHLAQIVTNSYGFNTEILPFGFIKPYEDTILQGAAEGIGIYFSSGDNSDESLVDGYRSTDWPASSPFVTAVGGTSLAVGASNNYLFETGWGTKTRSWTGTTWARGGWLYGAGGGVSRLFAEPAYQSGVVQQSVFTAQGRTGRAVPDIAAFADPNTGYIIGETQTFPDGSVKYSEYRIGGTSLSSPIMAGIMALADQKAGKVHGFANPLFYSKAGSSAFTDIVNPTSTVAVVRVNYANSVDASQGLLYRLRVMNYTLSLHTTPGWDDVTGLGTPTEHFLDVFGS